MIGASGVQPASAALQLWLGMQARHAIADKVCGAHGIIRALDVCGPLCGGGAELRPISAAFDSFIDADTLACLGGGNSATNIYMNNRGDNPFG